MKIPSWVEKSGLFLFSFIFTTFILYTFLEFFPALPAALNLNKVHYYSLKGRYLQDPDLVFRNRPQLKIEGFFTGDIQGLSRPMTPRPYTTQFDSEGFRNAKKPAHTDIVVLGDSFMQFGLNEADTFASRLEKASGLTAANYGTEWYGPLQYVEVLKKFAVKRSPRIAIFSFFEGNDLRDTVQFLNWKNGGDYYHFNLTSKNFLERYPIALKDTMVYFLKLFLKQWDPRKTVITLNGQSLETVFVYGLDSRSAEEVLNSKEGKAVSGALEELKKFCALQNIRPLVFFIPSTADIYKPYSSEAQAPDSHVEEAVQKAAADAQIDFLSLGPAYRQAAREGKMLYYTGDTHWNEEGRQIAADSVKEKLEALNLKTA